jgi:tetratricopeptide (TPR) repeat protein
LGIALSVAGKLDDAIAAYRTALQLRPDYALAHTNLGYALMLQGKIDEAIDQYRAALQANPHSAPAHTNLGSGLLQRGDTSEALSHFEEALRIDPASAEAHYNIGRVSQARGDFAEAIVHYRDAVRLKADLSPALADLAWLLATGPDEGPSSGAEAVRLAEGAAILTARRSASVMDVLAAAYAAAGLYDQAIATAQAALGLAPQGSSSANAIRERQELYKQHRPYRLKLKD